MTTLGLCLSAALRAILGLSALAGADRPTLLDICKDIEKIASLNGKIVTITGELIATDHGAILSCSTKHTIVLRGVEWPAAVYLVPPDSSSVLHPEANTQAFTATLPADEAAIRDALHKPNVRIMARVHGRIEVAPGRRESVIIDGRRRGVGLGQMSQFLVQVVAYRVHDIRVVPIK